MSLAALRLLRVSQRIRVVGDALPATIHHTSLSKGLAGRDTSATTRKFRSPPLGIVGGDQVLHEAQDGVHHLLHASNGGSDQSEADPIFPFDLTVEPDGFLTPAIRWSP